MESYSAVLAQRRKVRHEAIQMAVAKAYVLGDARAHRLTDWVEFFWDMKAGWPPTRCQILAAGVPKTAIARLRQGKLGIEDKLGCWTGEFLWGLKLSGALAEKEAGLYRIDSKHHPELVKDIHDWILAGRLGRPDRDGRRRLIECPAATHLPVEDAQGAGVIAGLFAGARLSEIGGDHWIELPDREQVKQLLDGWTILHYPSRRKQRRSYLKVSPFYAPLFAGLSPEHSRERILNIRKPAMCPLLPVLYWEWAFSLVKKGMRTLPFGDALPFGCSRRTFYRRGWRRKGLHRKAVLEYGILSVDPRLRDLMERWFVEHEVQPRCGLPRQVGIASSRR